MMEFEIVKSGEGFEVSQESMKLVQRARELDLKIAEMKIELDAIKEAAKVAMENAGSSKIETPFATFKMRKASTRTSKKVDYEWLKENDLYDAVVTEVKTPVSPSVVVEFHD